MSSLKLLSLRTSSVSGSSTEIDCAQSNVLIAKAVVTEFVQQDAPDVVVRPQSANGRVSPEHERRREDVASPSRSSVNSRNEIFCPAFVLRPSSFSPVEKLVCKTGCNSVLKDPRCQRAV